MTLNWFAYIGTVRLPLFGRAALGRVGGGGRLGFREADDR